MTKIIAFAGKKGSGKSTASNYLEAKLTEKGYRVERMGFKTAIVKKMKEELADTLYELSVIYDLTIGELFDQKPPAMRALMQNYGTEIYRNNFDENYWALQFTYNAVISNAEIIIVDDVRFENEYKTLEYLGATIYRIVRPNYDDGVNSNHSSETAIDHIELPTLESVEKENLFALIDEKILSTC